MSSGAEWHRMRHNFLVDVQVDVTQDAHVVNVSNGGVYENNARRGAVLGRHNDDKICHLARWPCVLLVRSQRCS